jgi:hypothetical protein
MKTISFLTMIAVSASVSAQQLQNPNFEEWTQTGTNWDGEPIYSPEGWSGAVQTTDSHSGTYAATVSPILSCGIFAGWMMYGQPGPNFDSWFPGTFEGSGAPVDFKPFSVTGYFKFLSPNDSTDMAQGIVLLKKFNALTQQSEEVGRGELTFTPTPDYTAFSIDITDLMPGIQPDTIVVAFSSGLGYSWDWETDIQQYGTLYIDQLRVQSEAVAGVEEQDQVVCSFFPNPSDGTMHFTLKAPMKDEFHVQLTDLAGKTVLAQRAEPGVQQTLDLSGLAAGSYRAFIKGKKGIYAVENIRVGQ